MGETEWRKFLYADQLEVGSMMPESLTGILIAIYWALLSPPISRVARRPAEPPAGPPATKVLSGDPNPSQLESISDSI